MWGNSHEENVRLKKKVIKLQYKNDSLTNGIKNRKN